MAPVCQPWREIPVGLGTSSSSYEIREITQLQWLEAQIDLKYHMWHIYISSKSSKEHLQGFGSGASGASSSFASSQPNISHKLISNCPFFLSAWQPAEGLSASTCPFLWKLDLFQASNQVLYLIIKSWCFASFRHSATYFCVFVCIRTNEQLATFLSRIFKFVCF